MNKVFRFLGMGALAVTFTAVGAASASAQDACANVEAKQATYKVFTDNYAGTTVEARKSALNAAKEYVEKYGACTEDKQQVEYFQKYIPDAEKQVADMVKAKAAADELAKMQPLYTRFNNGMKAKNWDEVYASGKEILAQEKNQETALNVTIVMGSIGFDETFKKNEKYNADTIRYAEEAIRKIESGQTSKEFGSAVPGVNYAYGNKDGALGSLNYIVGFLKYNTGAKDKKSALPYLYKATQFNSPIKTLPELYQGIGSYYLDELVRLEKDRQSKLQAANNVDTDETKAIFALQKGYAERAMDAYARAYKLIDAAKDKARKDAVYTNIKTTYEFRNNGKLDGLNDTYISSLTTKPMPNPTTEVTPIVEAPVETAPATDTNTTSTTKPSTAVTAPSEVKAATATAVKAPASTTAVKAPAKKPAPKKKGTR